MMTKEKIFNLCESVPLMVSMIFVYFYKKYSTLELCQGLYAFYKFKILFL
jgi:hypothetical protein